VISLAGSWWATVSRRYCGDGCGGDGRLFWLSSAEGKMLPGGPLGVPVTRKKWSSFVTEDVGLTCLYTTYRTRHSPRCLPSTLARAVAGVVTSLHVLYLLSAMEGEYEPSMFDTAILKTHITHAYTALRSCLFTARGDTVLLTHSTVGGCPHTGSSIERHGFVIYWRGCRPEGDRCRFTRTPADR